MCIHYEMTITMFRSTEIKFPEEKQSIIFYSRYARIGIITRLLSLLTFHDKDNGANIAFSYNYRTSRKRDGIHAIDNFSDLREFQVLHKVIVQYSSLDQFARSWNRKLIIISWFFLFPAKVCSSSICTSTKTYLRYTAKVKMSIVQI